MQSGAVWLPLAAAVLVVLFISRDGGLLIRLAAIAAAIVLLLSIPGRAPGQTVEVMMPPDEYIHPFAGNVVVMELPHKTGAPVLSLSHHGGGVCAIWLPNVGEPNITPELYQCLMVIEVANCNGAVDINLPAVKARTPYSEEARYGRTCSERGWRRAYDRVRVAAAGH